MVFGFKDSYLLVFNNHKYIGYVVGILG